MSDRRPIDSADYSPFSRVEERAQRVPELVTVLVAIAGLFVQGGRLGALASVVLIACWMYLQVEFIFAVGIVLFVGLGGEPISIGAALATTGLAGLLAVNVAHTWESVKPIALFLALFVAGCGGVLITSRAVALHWLGVGGGTVLTGAIYLLHRCERVRFEVINASGGPDDERSRTGTAKDDESRTETRDRDARSRGETT
jgi:predicted ABC-type sugar transport system permease subunit